MLGRLKLSVIAVSMISLIDAQTPLPRVETIEPAVNQLLAAMHAGTTDTITSLISDRSRRYSPGGVGLGSLRQLPASFWSDRGKCSYYVRHIQVLTAESALVIGLWRCPQAPPPQDAGMFDWTMRLESGDWKLLSWRDGYVPSPHLADLKPAVVNGDGILTAAERSEGWRALFDGKTSTGWVTPAGDSRLPTGWRIAEGSLTTVTGDVERVGIRTREEFTNFDLRFEWQVSAKANSGCLYRLYTVDFIGSHPGPIAAGGLEYQIADDDGDPGARVDLRQKSGALYSVIPVTKPSAKPVSEWNESRIIVTSKSIEHWLNGVQTANYAVDIPFASPILLQHHSSEVRFRKLRIRRLP